jgi:hypothetical protein
MAGQRNSPVSSSPASAGRPGAVAPDAAVQAPVTSGAAVIVPSGDTTGATDTANINGALAQQGAGTTTQLADGTFYLDEPIVIPPYQALQGVPSSGSIGTVSCGTVLEPVAGFSAGKWPVAAVVLFVDQATGGFGTPSEEQHVLDIMIQGTSLPPTSNVQGIAVFSGAASIGRISVRNILIHAMTGWGFYVPHGVGQIRGFNIGIRACGANTALSAGGFLVHCADSEWLYCSSYSNHSDAWRILNSFDSLFKQCHGEHSPAGYGFSYRATYNNSRPDAGGITFEGCTVDAGAQHGFFITSSGSANPPVNVIGGYVRRCGTSSTSAGFAGYCVDGYFGPVNFVGCQTYPGLPDSGHGSNTPEYGMAFVNNARSTNITVTGGVYIGAADGIHNDGSAALVTVSASTSFGHGQAAGTVVYTPGVTLQAAASAEFLPVDPILPLQPAGCLATSHDRQQITGSFSPVSGTAYYRLVRLVAGLPVTRINMWVTKTAKTGGTHGFVNIVSVATGRVVASSADLTDPATTWGRPNRLASIPLTQPYVPPVTGAYWLGFMVAQTSGTMPTVGGPDATPDAGIVTVSPVYCGFAGTGLTGPPAVGATVAPQGVRADDFYVFAT